MSSKEFFNDTEERGLVLESYSILGNIMVLMPSGLSSLFKNKTLKPCQSPSLTLCQLLRLL